MSYKRVIVGMSGATGQIIGKHALEKLSEMEVETHLVISETAEKIIEHELRIEVDEVKSLSTVIHDNNNLASPLSSGSFRREGMIIAPCSMKTLSAVANGHTNRLIPRAADVTLKERKSLILLAREKPLNKIHLKNMLKVSQAGGVVMPPVPSFYNRPNSIAEIVDEIAQHAIELLDSSSDSLRKQWEGFDEIGFSPAEI